MADDFTGKDLIDLINKEQEEERADLIDKNAAYFVKKRKAALRELGKTEEEVNAQLAEERKALETSNKKEQFEAEKKRLEILAKEAATLEERNAAKAELRQKKLAEDIVNATSAVFKSSISSFNSLYDKITASANFYSDLISDIETRLIGSGKTYASVADMVSKAFAVSPFFSMQEVMSKTAEAIDKGIAFNVELRSSMAVLSEKVAKTFDAFDSNLLRLIRIQQQDSTQARLGMENALTRFFNSQYQDTSYLNDISDSVSAALLEASATMSRNQAAELEYSVQKWLGSAYSVGLSQTTTTRLAEGFGYLGSGNISALSSDSSLESLLVAAANRGGVSYGDILSEGLEVSDVTGIMTGLRSLVDDITKSGNLVALNQYAEVFGLTMSDLRSVLNITAEDIKAISSDMLSYDGAIKNLENEVSAGSLLSRTSVQEITENLFNNIIGNAGQEISSSAGGYISWRLAGMVNEFLEGITTGVEFAPFGIGTSIDLAIGDITKAATVMGGLMSGLGNVFSGLSSIGGINLNALENVEVVSRGNSESLSSIREGITQSEKTFVGDTSSSAIYNSAIASSETAVSKVTDTNLDEEKIKVEKTQRAIDDINDNVAMILQLLNIDGIVIRGNAGEVGQVVFDKLAGGFVNR